MIVLKSRFDRANLKIDSATRNPFSVRICAHRHIATYWLTDLDLQAAMGVGMRKTSFFKSRIDLDDAIESIEVRGHFMLFVVIRVISPSSVVFS